MIQLNIPITSSVIFSIFHLFSVPIPVSGSIFEIIPLESNAIAVDPRFHDYLTLSKNDLSNCITLPDHSKLCPVLQIYNSQQHPSCEMQLLSKHKGDTNIPDLCSLTKVNISRVSIIETSKPNVWIFALPSINTVTFIGPLGSQFQENLHNSGELTLNPGTTAIIHGITIKTHSSLNSTTRETWNQSIPMKLNPLKSAASPPPINPSLVSHLPKLIPLWDPNNIGKINERAANLHHQISTIKIQEINNSFSYHFIALYICMSIFLIFLGWTLYNKYLQHIWNYCHKPRDTNISGFPEIELVQNINSDINEEPSIEIHVPNLPSPCPRARYV